MTIKNKKTKFYVTTAIDYPNAEPHIGHAYQKIVADALARWHKLIGDDVWFLTGTDEHGKKIQEAAEKQNKDTKEFVDEVSEKFKFAWNSLNIQPNRFIRTTDKDHEKLVQEVIKECEKKGDIYKGKYEGLYCVGCEAYYTEQDAPGCICPLHNRKLEKIEEESYFFRLSNYGKFLLELYKKNPEFLLPVERRNEITNRVKEGLKDLSISRTSFKWGIPFPGDKKHIVYVWFDALFNYLTGSGKKQEYWPANVHLLGKDNGWFHAVYWPAFLKSAGYELPKTVFVHGFLSFNGQKISKSLGNAISPITLVEKYGADSIRYFCLRNFAFAEGNDGDFSEKTLIERHNSELADKFGNLVSRVSALAEKYGFEKTKNSLLKSLKQKQIEKHMNNYEVDKALNEIFAFIDVCNEYVQNKKPWETHDKKVLYELLDSIRNITILLSPFIPGTCEKVAKQFNFELKYSEIGKSFDFNKIYKSEVLFKKIEFRMETNVLENSKFSGTSTQQSVKFSLTSHPSLNKQENKKEEKINKPQTTSKIEGITNMADLIKYDDFAKLDLRIGTIKHVEDVEGADKLLKLSVDIGEKHPRTILAGLKKYYSKDELKGKQVIVIANLEPRKMRGLESQGMLLAAASGDDSKVVLLSPEKKADNGWKVM